MIPLWQPLVYPSSSPCVRHCFSSPLALSGLIRGFLCQWIFCTHASHPHINPWGSALFYACPLPITRPINGLSVGRFGPRLLHATRMGCASWMPLMVCPKSHLLWMINPPHPFRPHLLPSLIHSYTLYTLWLQETDCKTVIVQVLLTRTAWFYGHHISQME